MKIRVIDTETTGLPSPTERHAVVEMGYTDLIAADREGMVNARIFPPTGVLCNPGREIPPTASGVHHIRDRDVVGCLSPDRVFRNMYDPEVEIFAAHNAEFDQQFYTGGDKPWICTKRVAIMMFQDLPDVRNQTLRYVFGVDDRADFQEQYATRPHRAPDDSYVTAFVLREMIREERASIEQMIEWTMKPILLPKFPMNPHKGQPWNTVPKSFINWAMSKSDIRNDRDFAHTARFWLKQ